MAQKDYTSFNPMKDSRLIKSYTISTQSGFWIGDVLEAQLFYWLSKQFISLWIIKYLLPTKLI